MTGEIACVVCRSEAALHELAATLALKLQCGDCVALVGDLGAGKTSFARGVIQALCGTETAVSSPTFTLLQTYESARGELFHFDLYRLEHASELLELGLEEAIDEGITLIEWPQIATSYLPESHLQVEITQINDENTRQVRIYGSQEWPKRLEGVIP